MARLFGHDYLAGVEKAHGSAAVGRALEAALGLAPGCDKARKHASLPGIAHAAQAARSIAQAITEPLSNQAAEGRVMAAMVEAVAAAPVKAPAAPTPAAVKAPAPIKKKTKPKARPKAI